MQAPAVSTAFSRASVALCRPGVDGLAAAEEADEEAEAEAAVGVDDDVATDGGAAA